MDNVVDLDGLINLLEQAKALRAERGNIAVSMLVRQETSGYPGDSYFEERDLPSELRLSVSTIDPSAVEIVV